MKHYNLKIKTLQGGWQDMDKVILHSCFQCLVYCVEDEELFESWAWAEETSTAKVKNEIEFLYNWWKEYSKSNNNDTDEESEMLKRLIDIKDYLWT